jgi:hypothetical protein
VPNDHIKEIRVGDIWAKADKTIEVVGGGRGWVEFMGRSLAATSLLRDWTRTKDGIGRRIWSRK